MPPHRIGIWLGAYKRRMLESTGRAADGWVPSLGYAAPDDLGRMTRVLDAAAESAGRDPAAVRRAFNISGRFTARGAGFLQGPPALWADQLTALVLDRGMSVFILGPGADPAGDLRRFAGEVAPAVRETVERARAGAGPAAVSGPGRPRLGRLTLPPRPGRRRCWRCTSICGRSSTSSARSWPRSPPAAPAPPRPARTCTR